MGYTVLAALLAGASWTQNSILDSSSKVSSEHLRRIIL